MGGGIVSFRLSSYLQVWETRMEDGVACRWREKARAIGIVYRTRNNGGKKTKCSAAGPGQRLESDEDDLCNVAFHSFARCGVSAMLVSHCLEVARLPACLAPLQLHSLEHLGTPHQPPKIYTEKRSAGRKRGRQDAMTKQNQITNCDYTRQKTFGP
jgi:hypothetical protein